MTSEQPISSLPEEEQVEKYEDIATTALRERDRILRTRELQRAGSDLASKVRSEEDAAALYDRLSPGELTKLCAEQPEEWKRLLEAKRAVGDRALMKWR